MEEWFLARNCGRSYLSLGISIKNYRSYGDHALYLCGVSCNYRRYCFLVGFEESLIMLVVMCEIRSPRAKTTVKNTLVIVFCLYLSPSGDVFHTSLQSWLNLIIISSMKQCLLHITTSILRHALISYYQGANQPQCWYSPILSYSQLWYFVIILASPGHQHPWYWLCRIGRSFFYMRMDFNYLCLVNVEEWHKM